MTNREFVLPKHLDYLDERLVVFAGEVIRATDRALRTGAKARRVGPRLMVFMPPRHGKSNLISHLFPCWFLGAFPWMRAGVVSYNGDLASEWGRQNRALFEEHGMELYGTMPSSKTRGVSDWRLDAGGGFRSGGIGTGLTGRGLELLVIDDPVKDQNDALSERLREKAWNWWMSTGRTRLQPGAGVILVMTRWHEDDLAGRLLERAAEDPEADQWEVIKFPALAEGPDLLGREEGDALWPEQYDEASLDNTLASSSLYWFSAMYQQEPGPADGAILQREWIGYYDIEPETKKEVCQSWDLTFDETTGGSFVVGQVWSSDLADRYLLAQIRKRMSFTDSIAAIKALTAYCEKRNWKKESGSMRIFIEKKANGAAAISTLRKELPGIVALEANDSKESRMHAVTPRFESMNVHVPRAIIPAPPGYDATKTAVLVKEWTSFPVGSQDDQVDAMTQVIDRMRDGKAQGTGQVRHGR